MKVSAKSTKCGPQLSEARAIIKAAGKEAGWSQLRGSLEVGWGDLVCSKTTSYEELSFGVC